MHMNVFNTTINQFVQLKANMFNFLINFANYLFVNTLSKY